MKLLNPNKNMHLEIGFLNAFAFKWHFKSVVQPENAHEEKNIHSWRCMS